MSIPHIKIQNASMNYGARVVFSHLNLELPQAKWVALIGKSGIGKSSLMRAIAGLVSREANFSGQITADNGQKVGSQTVYLSQNDALLPWLTVLQNVLLPLKLRGFSRREAEQSRAKATDLLKRAGLEDAIHFYPYQLSGGMRKRAALVRTLFSDKPIVLLDEPFSALDTITRYQLQNLAVQLLRAKTVFFITHDPAEALRLANIIYLLQGQPATLELIAQLTDDLPRNLADEKQQQLYQQLFQRLLQHRDQIS